MFVHGRSRILPNDLRPDPAREVSQEERGKHPGQCAEEDGFDGIVRKHAKEDHRRENEQSAGYADQLSQIRDAFW